MCTAAYVPRQEHIADMAHYDREYVMCFTDDSTIADDLHENLAHLIKNDAKILLPDRQKYSRDPEARQSKQNRLPKRETSMEDFVVELLMMSMADQFRGTTASTVALASQGLSANTRGDLGYQHTQTEGAWERFNHPQEKWKTAWEEMLRNSYTRVMLEGPLLANARRSHVAYHIVDSIPDETAEACWRIIYDKILKIAEWSSPTTPEVGNMLHLMPALQRARQVFQDKRGVGMNQGMATRWLSVFILRRLNSWALDRDMPLFDIVRDEEYSGNIQHVELQQAVTVLEDQWLRTCDAFWRRIKAKNKSLAEKVRPADDLDSSAKRARVV